MAFEIIWSQKKQQMLKLAGLQVVSRGFQCEVEICKLWRNLQNHYKIFFATQSATYVLVIYRTGFTRSVTKYVSYCFPLNLQLLTFQWVDNR